MSRVEELKAAYEAALAEAKLADRHEAALADYRAALDDPKAKAAYRRAVDEIVAARQARREAAKGDAVARPETVAASVSVETPSAGG